MNTAAEELRFVRIPVDSVGVAFDVSQIHAGGSISADMTANVAAEATGRPLAVRPYSITGAFPVPNGLPQAQEKTGSSHAHLGFQVDGSVTPQRKPVHQRQGQPCDRQPSPVQPEAQSGHHWPRQRCAGRIDRRVTGLPAGPDRRVFPFCKERP